MIENIAPYGYNTYKAITLTTPSVKQVGRLIETFHRVLEANPDKMELALTAADVWRIVASGKMAVVLGIESGFDQEGDIDILRPWYRLGVRLIQFSSQVTNAYADSSVRGEARWNGINRRGRRLIAEMNRLGIMIDIAHATEAAQRQIIEASRAPVVDSHTGMRSICNNPANMPDDILRALAAKGGVVGIHSSAAVISQRYNDCVEDAGWGRFFSRPAGSAAGGACTDSFSQSRLRRVYRRPRQRNGRPVAALVRAAMAQGAGGAGAGSGRGRLSCGGLRYRSVQSRLGRR